MKTQPAYVLMHRNTVVGYFDSFYEAFQYGLGKFDPRTFLVEKREDKALLQ